MSPARSATDGSMLLHIDGLQIAMRVQGAGDPLLLINGMTRPLDSWEAFTRELPGRTIISFDVPGVGGSPTPLLPLSIPALAKLAVAVLDAAGLDEADVLGLSHGGGVAQQLAYDAPSRVRRLVLVATSCGVGATPGRRRALFRSLATPSDGLWPRPDPLGVLWQSLAIASWSSIPFLGAIRAPTLVVCGTHDRVAPPANSRVLARRIPGAAFVLVPGGHDLQRPDPARALARVVEEFLSGESADAAAPRRAT
jgi:poly(3-hydroxyoctanoate) depolymerase